MEILERLKNRLETVTRQRDELAEIVRHSHILDGNYSSRRAIVLKEIGLENEAVKAWGVK